MDYELNELFGEDPEILALMQDYGNSPDSQALPNPENISSISRENPLRQNNPDNEPNIADYGLTYDYNSVLTGSVIPELSNHQNSANEYKIPDSTAILSDFVTAKTPKKKIFALSNIIFYGILFTFLLICILFAFSGSKQKSIFGFRLYSVLTESMAPKYEAGDMVIVKVTKAPKIAVGDVITFVPPGDREDVYLTHRVESAAVNDAGNPVFVTKGDANPSADPFQIPGENIIGKVVFSIPGGGGFISFIQKNLLLSIIFIAALFCLIILIRQFVGSKKPSGA